MGRPFSHQPHISPESVSCWRKFEEGNVDRDTPQWDTQSFIHSPPTHSHSTVYYSVEHMNMGKFIVAHESWPYAPVLPPTGPLQDTYYHQEEHFFIRLAVLLYYSFHMKIWLQVQPPSPFPTKSQIMSRTRIIPTMRIIIPKECNKR